MANRFEHLLTGGKPHQQSQQATTGNRFEHLIPKATTAARITPPTQPAAQPVSQTPTPRYPTPYGPLPAAHGPVNYNNLNPIVGENLFLTNTFPIRQQDNPAVKALKGAGNVATSILAAPGEGLRTLSLQGGSVLTGGGIRKDLPRNTSFTQDILPKGASAAVDRFSQAHPTLGGLAQMGIETIADPTSFLTAKTAGNAFFRKNPIEELGANLGAKAVPRAPETPGLRRTTGQTHAMPKRVEAEVQRIAEPVKEAVSNAKPPTTNIINEVDRLSNDLLSSLKERETLGTLSTHEKNLLTALNPQQVVKSELDTVYHGTNKNFKEFDKTQNKASTLHGPAFYFTDSLESAKKYATEYQGNAGNPRVIGARLNHTRLWDYNKDKITPEQFEEVFNYYGEYPVIKEPTLLGELRGVNDVTGGLKELGYDGFRVIEKDGSTTYAVFNPKQIAQVSETKLLDNAMPSKTEPQSSVKPEVILDSLARKLETPGDAPPLKAEPPVNPTPLKEANPQPNPDVRRMSFPDTVAKAEITTPEMQKFLKDMDYDYTVKHNADTLAKAQAVVKADPEEALRKVLTDYDGSAEMNTQALLLYKSALDTGDMGIAADIVTQIASNSKTQGQAIQALSMWGRLTPDGILRTAERTIEKALNPDQTKRLANVSGRVTKGLQDVNKKAADDIAREVEKNVEKILKPKQKIEPKDIKPRKTTKQKAEVINLKLDAAADAARKRLAANKGRVMSGIPVDALADYSIIGATYIAKGAVKFSAWSIDMVKEFGEELRPHLQLIWDKSKQAHDDIARQVGDEADVEELAGRIKTALNDPKEKDAVANLVDTLFKVAKEKLPNDEVVKRSNALNFISDAITSRDKYRQVWTQAREILTTQLEDEPEKLAIVMEYLNKNIKRTFPQNQLNKAVGQGLRDIGADVGKIVRQHYSVNTATRKDLANRLISEAGLSGEETDILAKHVFNRMKDLTKQKKEQILKQTFGVRPLSPRKDVSEKIIELSNLGAFQNKKYTDLVAKKLGMPSLDDATRKNLVQQSRKLQTMAEGREKQVATARMLDTIQAQIPTPMTKKVATVHTMGQLLNFKTLVRNILGNTGMMVGDNVSDIVGAGYDAVISNAPRLVGKDALARKKTLPNFKSQGKGFVKGLRYGYEDAMLGIDTSGVKNKFEVNQTRAFRTDSKNPIIKTLGYLETGLNIGLRATDRAFAMAAYEGSLANQMKAAKVTRPTLQMEEMATLDSLVRTFQDDTKLSDLFVKLKKGINKLTGSENFGGGDFVMKYPKTPANLLLRGLDYSPVGVFKVMTELVRPLIKKQEFNQKAFVEALSRATVGTVGLTGAGAWLHGKGIITAKAPSDPDVRNLEQQVGLGQYKLNASALKRFVLSGLNEKEANLREGDTLISFDWFQPFAFSIALGADFDANRGENKGFAGSLLAGIGSNALPAVMTAVNTLADQPVLQGVQDLLGQREASSGVAQILRGVPASFVPTLVNQIKQISDNQKRVTYSPNWFEEMSAAAKAKIPGWEKTLPRAYETLGAPRQTYQNKSNSLFNVLLNPAFVTKYKPSPEAKLALDIYRNAGTTTQLPRSAPKYITVDGKRFEFTPKEYSEFQRIIGEETQKGFARLTSSMPVSQMTEAEREGLTKAMVNVLDDAAEEGKKRILDMRKIGYFFKSGNLKIQ